MTAGNLALDLAFSSNPLEGDIEKIHLGTAIYTAQPEIEALLDRLHWPETGERLLDPGAGNGGIVLAALRRLHLPLNDLPEAVRRVKGYEFHPGAAVTARQAIAEYLRSLHWSPAIAEQAAQQIIEIKDFLLTPVPAATFDRIVANPPYWRILRHLPPESAYRIEYEASVPAHARADLLYAYLQRAADIVTADGLIGLVTADRWLLNSSSAELRAKLGTHYTVMDLHRLESESAFYRPKARRKGSPARVHPVSLILSPSDRGRPLTREPFALGHRPTITNGRPLPEICTIRLAPWLGPDGIFVVDEPGNLPRERLIPCVEPKDLDTETGSITPRRFAILTSKDEEPTAEIQEHLRKTLSKMPPRGQRKPFWLPPEIFAGKLPLSQEAVLVPRISKKLRPLRLPAGVMPFNHNIMIISDIAADDIIRILEDPEMQAQADALALRLENGYHSYTATLLRKLIVPERLLPVE